MFRMSLALFLVAAATKAGAPSLPAPSAKCPNAEFRQFDFWIGDWDTFETDGSVQGSIARTHVDAIAGGCGIHELYEQTDGLIGDSILNYDPIRKEWQQTWVSNRGSVMVIYGAFKDGAVTMEGESHQNNGKKIKQKITWKAEGDSVREYSTWSKDGGRTWEPAFDVTFKPHVEKSTSN